VQSAALPTVLVVPSMWSNSLQADRVGCVVQAQAPLVWVHLKDAWNARL
jgi:hypothetical protein